MTPTSIPANTIWETESRKGRLLIKPLKAVDLTQDTFFDAEIITGKAMFASKERCMAQALDGDGTPGEVLSFRTSLIKFGRRRHDFEAGSTGAAPDPEYAITLLGKDHWSTLAYIETIIVDRAEFVVGYDQRMRQNEQHHAEFIMAMPERPRAKMLRLGVHNCKWDDKCSTIMADGQIVVGHDDWDCVIDLMQHGFFAEKVEDFRPGTKLHLSAKGRAWAEELRLHKSSGGTFGNFKAKVALFAEQGYANIAQRLANAA